MSERDYLANVRRLRRARKIQETEHWMIHSGSNKGKAGTAGAKITGSMREVLWEAERDAIATLSRRDRARLMIEDASEQGASRQETRKRLEDELGYSRKQAGRLITNFWRAG